MPKKPKTMVRRRAVKRKKNFWVSPTAMVENNVQIGEGTKVWHFSQIRQGSQIGKNCVIGKAVFIDFETVIGNNVKIQNQAIIYHRAIIEDGVFIGPNVCFTNDKIPRAINPDGSLKSTDDWEISTIKIGKGASVGGHSVILPGVTIGRFAMVGAGAVVTKDVPAFALVYGNPAAVKDFVCKCGKKLTDIIAVDDDNYIFRCQCGQEIGILKKDYKQKPDYEKKKIWLR